MSSSFLVLSQETKQRKARPILKLLPYLIIAKVGPRDFRTSSQLRGLTKAITKTEFILKNTKLRNHQS